MSTGAGALVAGAVLGAGCFFGAGFGFWAASIWPQANTAITAQTNTDEHRHLWMLNSVDLGGHAAIGAGPSIGCSRGGRAELDQAERPIGKDLAHQ